MSLSKRSMDAPYPMRQSRSISPSRRPPSLDRPYSIIASKWAQVEDESRPRVFWGRPQLLQMNVSGITTI